MKRLTGIIVMSLIMMSLTSFADVEYSSLGRDPSKLEPRADGVLVSKESGEIVVSIDQYEAEAACADHGGLPDINTLADMMGTNPHKEDSEEKCSDTEHAHRIGPKEYLCYTPNPQSVELGNYQFWSSSVLPVDGGGFAIALFNYYNGINYALRGVGFSDVAARCAR